MYNRSFFKILYSENIVHRTILFSLLLLVLQYNTRRLAATSWNENVNELQSNLHKCYITTIQISWLLPRGRCRQKNTSMQKGSQRELLLVSFTLGHKGMFTNIPSTIKILAQIIFANQKRPLKIYSLQITSELYNVNLG